MGLLMDEFLTVNSTTFKTESEEVRETIVGNSKSSSFEPMIEAFPWEKEHGDCLKFWKDTSLSQGISVNTSDKSSLIWEDSDSKMIFATAEGNFFGFPELAQTMLPRKFGGAKFAWYLTQRPIADPDGLVRFTMRMSGHEDMDFHMRAFPGDPLHDIGTPPIVDGCLCISHKTKANNCPGSTFKCGKVCTIFRPWVIDSQGGFGWGHFEYDLKQGTITKCFKKEVFDTSATWWLVDETFGNDGGGSGTGNPIDNYILSTRVGHSPASNGTVNTLHSHLYASSITARDLQMALHNDADASYIADSATDSVSSGTDIDGYVTFPYTGGGPACLAAVTYLISVWGNPAAGDVVHYDDGNQGSGTGYQENSADQWNWPTLAKTDYVRKAYNYVTYTPTDGVAPTGGLNGPLVGPLGGPI